LVAEKSATEYTHALGVAAAGKWRLIACAAPKSKVKLYFTIQPEQNNGVKVEKWATRFGTGFEKHIQPNGVFVWYKLVKIRE
jgi:hypothetical protein